MKFFDPACGSGNFLIITYKSLRGLENRIIQLILSIDNQGTLNNLFSMVHISQFYGIEIDDFACETAILSLWLAEHQMNSKFTEKFGVKVDALPLKANSNIHHGNACRLDWNEVCPHTPEEEVFVMGNPPYLGSRNQEQTHKDDLDYSLSDFRDYRKLDYIAIWFYYGAKYIKNKRSKCAFVSTNSITQGEQVKALWEPLFSEGININFAYTSFEWSNNAKSSAHVIVVIIGISNKKELRKLYVGDKIRTGTNINGYLSLAENIFITNRRKVLSPILQPMIYGNEPREGGWLMLKPEEKESILNENPAYSLFIKRAVGSNEFINSIERYCIWIRDNETNVALTSRFLQDRIDKVKEYRMTSKRSDTRKYANKPYKFTNITYNENCSSVLVIPVVSSANRDYIPMGYCDTMSVILNSAQVIYDASIITLGIISSKMHNIWVRSVAGKLKNDIRYSSTLCYNTFPFPSISDEKKRQIEDAANVVLDARDYHIGKTLAELYDPDKMPEDLRQAHHELDLIVDSCYQEKPFENDEERLECLFKLYEKMSKKE